MTRLFNDPDDFAAEMTSGLAAASARWLRAVPGGVVRSTEADGPTVSLVVGGGSGHYPAFAGLVGPGLAHGAAMGNLFASPSTQQVHAVAAAADRGRGVLMSYGNYAGDVLNFDAAQARLRGAGVDCRTVVVTDDVSSAADPALRRGIAGDLCVFKVAGAACEAGYDLDGVERVARLANERTRSLGVAFDGCTLPGAGSPLFTVPDGRMAVGLGIHGEPGIDETDVPTAAGLAELLVRGLLAERPAGAGDRVVPILNGLGSVKYEELYVVYGAVHRLLGEAGLTVVDPEVGEFCTSFDMAGASLTLLWLDDAPGELERLWTAPCDTPAFRRGAVAGHHGTAAPQDTAAGAPVAVTEGSPGSQACGARVAAAFDAVAAVLDAETDRLGRLDRVAGDGDHGIGMQRGGRAAREAAAEAAARGAGAGTVLRHAADAWGDRAGGTSGAIWAALLDALGTALGDTGTPDAAAVAAAVRASERAVAAAGGAAVGDKTMVDALDPFATVLDERVGAGEDLTVAWAAAADAAGRAAEDTARLTARLGRARAHGERSVGTPDPGAVSFALVVRTAGEYLC